MTDSWTGAAGRRGGRVARDRRGACAKGEKPRSRSTAARSRSALSTSTLSALSWDPADWNWKLNHDTGQFYEQLFAADLERASARAASIPSSPTPGCRPTPSAASWPRSWEWKREPAARRDQAAQGHHVPGEAGRDEGARAHRRRRRLQPSTACATSPKKHRGLLRPSSTRSRPPTSTPSSSPSRTTTPSGTTASAGATTRRSSQGGGRRRRHQLEERQRHRAVHADRLRAGQLQHLHRRTRTTGTRRRSAARTTSCRSSTRSIYRTIKDEATFITALRTAKLDILETIRWRARRRAEEERAAAASGRKLADMIGHVPGDARRHQAVRRHPRAPRAQHGGQQAGDRQGTTTAATPSCSPIRSIPTMSATSSRWRRCRTRSRSSSTTIPRRRRSCWPRRAIPTASPSRCRSAPAPRPHGPAAAGRGLPRAGRRQDRDPAAWSTARSCRP